MKKSKCNPDPKYLDDDEKAIILKAKIIQACDDYIESVNYNYTGPINWSAFYRSGYHADTDKAIALKNDIDGHENAQAMIPLLKNLDRIPGNYNTESLKVFVGKALVKILNMSKESHQQQRVCWTDKDTNKATVDCAIAEIVDWIQNPKIKIRPYRSFLAAIAEDSDTESYNYK